MRAAGIRWSVLLMGLLLACMPALAQRRAAPVSEPLTSVKTLQVEGNIVVDTQGRVEDYRLDTALDDPLRENVARAVRGWTFRPVLVDGVPRRASARMRITLAASSVGDGYEVRVDNVIFPGPGIETKAAVVGDVKDISALKLNPPIYPLGLMRANVSGVVLLAIRVDEDGKAADVAAVQTMLLDVRGKEKTLQLAAGMFEAASLQAARQWRFRLPADFAERTPERRIITVPIEYVMDRSDLYSKAGIWRTVVRTPKRQLAWMPVKPGTQAVGVADVGQGEFIPVASTMSLASDVVGKLL